MKKCKYCQTEIPDNAKICSNCHINLRDWLRQHPVRAIIFGGILLTALITCFLVFSSVRELVQEDGQLLSKPTVKSTIKPGTDKQGAIQEPTINPTKNASPVAPEKWLSVGDKGYLRMIGNSTEDVLLATTEKAMEEIAKYSIAGDTMGIAQMVLAGSANFVPAGTKVLIIDRNVGGRRVRIIEGEFTGADGWTPYEFIQSK